MGNMTGQEALDLGLMSAVSFSPGPILVQDGVLQTGLGGGTTPAPASASAPTAPSF